MVSAKGRTKLRGHRFSDFLCYEREFSPGVILVFICIESLEMFSFQISKLFIFRLSRRLFFWGKQPCITFLSCLFRDCRAGWLSPLISFQYSRGKDSGRASDGNPGEHRCLSNLAWTCQGWPCRPLHRELLWEGAVLGYRSYRLFAKQQFLGHTHEINSWLHC